MPSTGTSIENRVPHLRPLVLAVAAAAVKKATYRPENTLTRMWLRPEVWVRAQKPFVIAHFANKKFTQIELIFILVVAGDVDTSDATRQNSIEEEASIGSSCGEVETAENRDNKSQMSGFRRTFENFFGSLGKSSAIKPKVVEGPESSSTDAEQQKPAVKAHLCVSRTAPPVPQQQRFNRVARLV